MIDEARAAERRRQLERAKELHALKVKAAVQSVMRTPEGRFLLGEFFNDAGLDASPRHDKVHDTYHAIGWLDAASWWLNLVRAYCPEREAEIRKERIAYMKEAARGASQDSNNDDAS